MIEDIDQLLSLHYLLDDDAAGNAGSDDGIGVVDLIAEEELFLSNNPVVGTCLTLFGTPANDLPQLLSNLLLLPLLYLHLLPYFLP